MRAPSLWPKPASHCSMPVMPIVAAIIRPAGTVASRTLDAAIGIGSAPIRVRRFRLASSASIRRRPSIRRPNSTRASARIGLTTTPPSSEHPSRVSSSVLPIMPPAHPFSPSPVSFLSQPGQACPPLRPPRVRRRHRAGPAFRRRRETVPASSSKAARSAVSSSRIRPTRARSAMRPMAFGLARRRLGASRSLQSGDLFPDLRGLVFSFS